MRVDVKNLWKQNRGFIVFVVLMLMFRSAIADWNHVPTASMKPSILEGDRILIDKLAYDLRLPFTSFRLVQFDEPGRGDVVVFESQVSGKRLVKRVLGVPGDRVAMVDHRLVINGEPLSYQSLSEETDFLEHLGGSVHRVRIHPSLDHLANFAPVQVPRGQYLVLGDNRGNSADSRVIGMVPRAEIIGRAEKVIISLDCDNYCLPRAGRFLQSLDAS